MKLVSVVSLGLCITALSVGNAKASDSANIEKCNPKKSEAAQPGYLCQTDSATWNLEFKNGLGNQVWKDLQSGIHVANFGNASALSFTDAQKACSSLNGLEFRKSVANLSGLRWSLPTGYPQFLIEVLQPDGTPYPKTPSDFTMLETDKVRDVLPNLAHRGFWSRSTFSKEIVAVGAGADARWRAWDRVITPAIGPHEAAFVYYGGTGMIDSLFTTSPDDLKGSGSVLCVGR